jgi:hypothetical protein
MMANDVKGWFHTVMGEGLRTLGMLAVGLLLPSAALATPSTTFWTTAIASCQAAGVPHITYDTYFGKGVAPPGSGSPTYPIDTGITVGVIPSNKVQAEVGYDVFLPSSDPVWVFANAKLCIPEKAMGGGSPGISFGMYNMGFKKGVTDYNIFNVVVQKSFPVGGYVAGGYYHGFSDTLFTNSEGKVVQDGVIFAAVSPDIPVGAKGLKKINIIGDVQSGKNIFGAWGVGAAFMFTDTVGLIFGPVWYLDSDLQPGGAKHLYSMQVDIDIPFGKP